MKHKPAVKEVIDNISNFTDDDIDLMEGSHFPIWIKDQLKKLNKRGGKTADDIAEDIAAQMIKASQEEIK